LIRAPAPDRLETGRFTSQIVLAMTPSLDPLPEQNSDTILCGYINQSPQMQIVRITDIPDWYFERVVFPTQRLLFSAPAAAHLEIHTGVMASSMLSDRIPCLRLQLDDTGSLPPRMAYP
jgi:hypothetical protein